MLLRFALTRRLHNGVCTHRGVVVDSRVRLHKRRWNRCNRVGQNGQRNRGARPRTASADRIRRQPVERARSTPGRRSLDIPARHQHRGVQLDDEGVAVLPGAHQRHIGRGGFADRPVRGRRPSELHGLPVAGDRMGIRNRPCGH